MFIAHYNSTCGCRYGYGENGDSTLYTHAGVSYYVKRRMNFIMDSGSLKKCPLLRNKLHGKIDRLIEIGRCYGIEINLQKLR